MGKLTRRIGKDYQKLMDKHGFEFVRFTGKTHIMIRHTVTGCQTTIPGSPSDSRHGLRQAESDMKKLARGGWNVQVA